jgi:hypothetical protein
MAAASAALQTNGFPEGHTADQREQQPQAATRLGGVATISRLALHHNEINELPVTLVTVPTGTGTARTFVSIGGSSL